MSNWCGPDLGPGTVPPTILGGWVGKKQTTDRQQGAGSSSQSTPGDLAVSAAAQLTLRQQSLQYISLSRSLPQSGSNGLEDLQHQAWRDGLSAQSQRLLCSAHV